MKNKTFKDIQKVRFFDCIEIFKSIEKIENKDRLKSFLFNSGVTFFDKENSFVCKPSVGIVGIGGLTFNLDESSAALQINNSDSKLVFKDLKNIFNPIHAIGGFMSYLNTGNLDYKSMISVMHKHKHLSTLHMSVINIGIFGVSTLVENEFNCQRDIMHLARITEARTSVQNEPPVCVLYPEYINSFSKIYDHSKEIRSSIQQSNNITTKNHLESANLLYPSAKSTGFIISISLKNLLKLTSMLGDDGKEEEMKRVLALINDFSHKLWPKIFPSTSFYNYKYPQHLINNS